MCEQRSGKIEGWQGWTDVRPPPITGRGPWLDLSHPFNENIPRVPSVPAPRFPRFKHIPEDPFNVTEIHMVVHLGTHVDSPRHFFNDGPAFDEIPLERLYGPGVVWRIEAEPYQVIEPADLSRMRPELRPGDILLLDTTWSELVGTETYEQHPHLSEAAAEWLVEQKVKLLAVDFGTPDAVPEKRWEGWLWPVHHILLSRGVLIAEHVCNLKPLAGQRVEAMFLALNIEGSDGAPARVVARPVDD